MKGSRHPRWKTLTWPALVKEYRRHRRLPFVSGFGSVVPTAAGTLSRGIIAKRTAQGRQAAALLDATLDRLRRRGVLPSRPARLTQVAVNRIRRAAMKKAIGGVTAQGLQTFWGAIVLTRAAYRCEYSGRSATEIYRSRGCRTAVRMIIDHEQPPKRGRSSYTFANSVPACWSCDLLKSGLPRQVFEQELHSLAAAVTREQKLRR